MNGMKSTSIKDKRFFDYIATKKLFKGLYITLKNSMKILNSFGSAKLLIHIYVKILSPQ
jgi:hypothetical protein